MADNITLNSGSGGSVLATDDISSAHYQKILLGYGADGAWTRVNTGTGLPVSVDSFGTGIDQGAGAVGANTQRMTLASDDPGVALLTTIDADTGAIKTAIELLDNAVDGNYLNVNANIAGTDIVGGAGAVAAGVQRVTLASDDPAVALLTTIDADTGAIKTAAELIDDVILVLGTATYTEATTKGALVGAVRNDDLATLANTDNEIAPLQVDPNGALYVNQAAAEVKQASGVAAGGAPGADAMIAAVAGKKILVLALGLFATSATTNTVYIDNEDNDLLGNSGNGIALSLDADGDTVAGFVLPYNPGGWFKTDTVNEAVTLNTSAAQDIIWTITYIETD